MKIRVLGGGWYGSHLTLSLLKAGHDVVLHEISSHLFAGASGGNPARCHLGFHYPRSGLTQAACQEHAAMFMAEYGHLTRGVPVNIYAVADRDSLVDFQAYCHVLRGRVEFINIAKPEEFGLRNVEGAILTGERHIVISEAREHFSNELAGRTFFGIEPGEVDLRTWDWTIDCTFCANDAQNIDRFEPCVTYLLHGPSNRAVTIMDGPFPSIYPWDEARSLSSMTSASLTPLSKTCRTWQEANIMLQHAFDEKALHARGVKMLEQMANFYPEVVERYEIVGHRKSIRAMPRSAADARLADVVRVGERALRVRAGKIDAIFHAAQIVQEMMT
jgi:hypothetical protein